MTEIRVPMPGSVVVVTYASQCERDRSLRLAGARQRLVHEGAMCPPWAEQTETEREDAAREARNWLHAAISADIAESCPVHDDCGKDAQADRDDDAERDYDEPWWHILADKELAP